MTTTSGNYLLNGGSLIASNIILGQENFGQSNPPGPGFLTVSNTGILSVSSSVRVNQFGNLTLSGSQVLFDIPLLQIFGGSVSLTGTPKALRTSNLAFQGGINGWSGHLELSTDALIVQATSSNKASTLSTLLNQMKYIATGSNAPTISTSSARPMPPTMPLASSTIPFSPVRSWTMPRWIRTRSC